jgi:predicted SAM-dependent methyltransferase
MKLHLGCYQKKIHGFINVDIRDDVNPDLVDDVFKLNKIENDSVDLIYACHVLEHATFEESITGLKRWYRVLKKNGTLRISVPDLEAVFEHYIFHKDLPVLKTFLYGSQNHPYDFHRCGWDEKTMNKTLSDIGFSEIKKYDWRETEHFFIDDYSQTYLPEISYKTRRTSDVIKGKLMSLNIEAIK